MFDTIPFFSEKSSSPSVLLGEYAAGVPAVGEMTESGHLSL